MKNLLARMASSCLASMADFALAAPAPTAPDLPGFDPAYTGKIGRTIAESSPPQPFSSPLKAPKGAPNVLLIMTDDTGFGSSSVFGGPVPMPVLGRLASGGLVYKQFHTTALCSPTRAALLTGRNYHSVGFGVLTELASGYPGYNARLPRSAATIGEVLRLNGYATAWFGKNHNTPAQDLKPTGPFDRWPTGLGFEEFYGFMGGETNPLAPTSIIIPYRSIRPPAILTIFSIETSPTMQRNRYGFSTVSIRTSHSFYTMHPPRHTRRSLRPRQGPLC